MRRHCATERIEKILCLLRNALAASRFALEDLADGRSFPVFKGTDIESLDRGYGVGKGGRILGIIRRGRRQGENLEVLDSGHGDDVVVACLGLFGVGGIEVWFGVDGDEIGNRTGCEERSLEAGGGRGGSG